MRARFHWSTALIASMLLLTAPGILASPPARSADVTDFGRTRERTHYSPEEPEYPQGPDVQAWWEAPLGLSRSQPLVIRRDYGSGDRIRIFHVAGDRLWALNGDMRPPLRRPDQSVDAYRQQLADQGFILWSTPATALCSAELRRRDELLDLGCSKLDPPHLARPFASSHAAYWKAPAPRSDLLYVGFGYPASVAAVRVSDGKVLGGVIIEAGRDRGIVGAPLVFAGDTVVVGTTSGQVYIIQGMASGRATVRGLNMGGRLSFSPVPVDESSFIMAADARPAPGGGSQGYMMAYTLATARTREFTPRWAAAVVTPAGIPGEAAIDGQMLFVPDKHGKLYAFWKQNGELRWCKQFPGLGNCQPGDAEAAFINSGPGVDEQHVYFVFRNNRGPNRGNGQLVALDQGTGSLVWQRELAYRGNTAPVPMEHVVLVGDTEGYVRAYDKMTGAEVTDGGYPLRLTTEPYEGGDQGEEWWELIGGTATQMTVAAGLMLVGVNAKTEESTVLRAYKLYREKSPPTCPPECPPPACPPECPPPACPPECPPPACPPECPPPACPPDCPPPACPPDCPPPACPPECPPPACPPACPPPPGAERPDLVLEQLDTPNAAPPDGFSAKVTARCRNCTADITTTIALKVDGYELPRQRVSFDAGHGWRVHVEWTSGPQAEGADLPVVAILDPENRVEESDKSNNILRSTVHILMPSEPQNPDRWGSKLTD